MNVMLCPVREDDRDTLWRLLQYSLFEESATDGSSMNNHAIFEYPWFDRYFTDSDREAFLIQEQGTGHLVGFAMINTHVQKVVKGHSMAEFLVIPQYRRLGVGRQAALQCFDRHKGAWEVSPALGSERAKLFWKAVIGEYTQGHYIFEDRIFSFINA